MSQRTILSALLAITAFAGSVPVVWAQDARLSSRLYRPDEIVRVEGKLNVQATIAFGEGEKIENVAVGDSESWQIAPNKRADLLFIKPLSETARTNMTVVTDRHTYFFDLVASPKAQPIYSLRFTYATPAPAAVPEPVVAAAPAIAQSAGAAQAAPGANATGSADPRAEARRAAAAARAARAAEEQRLDDQRKAERQAARARAAADAKRAADARAAERAAKRAAERAAATVAAAPATVAAVTPTAASAPATAAAAPPWKRAGPRELMPLTIYDDGRATYAVWPPGKPLPQLLVADGQGREVPVEFAVDGERIVIPGVPGRIILRANGRSGTLEPGRPALAGRPDPAGR